MTVDVTVFIKFNQILEISLVKFLVTDLESARYLCYCWDEGIRIINYSFSFSDNEISIPGLVSLGRIGNLLTKFIIVIRLRS